MKILVNEKILDYENKPIKTEDEKNDVIWRMVFFTALNNFTPEENPTSEVKSKCYQLTTKIYKSKEVDLSVEERAFILERIKKIYNAPLICGRAEEFLEEKKQLNANI